MKKTTSPLREPAVRDYSQPPQREQNEMPLHRPPLGAGRVAPLNGETTLSFMSRAASRYKLTAKELIGALVDVGRRPNLFTVRPDGEVVFNAEARAVVAAFCRMPEEHLHRALPAWDRDGPSSRLGNRPAAWVRTAATIPPTGPGCRACTATATRGREEARRYLLPHGRVCVRHQCWMLEAPVVDGAAAVPGQLDLRYVPQIGAAQRRHVRLLRRSAHAGEAFTVAQAIMASWWDEPWPEEILWPDRLRLMAPSNDLAWRTAARDAVTYPEAVTLAAALADPSLQQRLLDDAGRHQPHALADVPGLVDELARRLERPWLAGRLSAITTGPLNAWVRACVRTRAGHKPKTRSMWHVSPPHRPAPITRLLAETRPVDEAPGKTESAGAPAPDVAETAKGFARGLRHARAYATEHGHLCIPYRHEKDGFQLGLWLSNQRAAGPQLSPERSQALAALDPWWNPAWSTLWQRIYLCARRLLDSGTDIRPEQGFPGTSENLGTWLYRQCQVYSSLHPQQRRLLAQIGISAEAARHALPRRRNLAEARDRGLTNARAYWKEHGHLCASSADTYADFPIGQWLTNLRVRARRGILDPALTQQLDAMDPWWAPPWPSDWQRACYTVTELVRSGHPLDPESAFAAFDDELGQWLYTQCVSYPGLAVEQRRQLAAVGLTEQTVQTARPNPATRRPSLETGLYYARSYAALHGDLNASPSDRHEGFPIGKWLARQKHQAGLHTAKFAAPYPAGPLLAAVDSWWNPPWNGDWQINHRAARRLVENGIRLLPDQGFPGTPDWTGQWLYTQCVTYQNLHPGQQHRLTQLGITTANSCTAQPRRVTQQASFDTGLAHARSYAARHGHLAVPRSTNHHGYRLGTWLAHQRKRAANGRLPHHRAEALDVLDSWWNPSWGLPWQIAYHAVRNEIHGHALNAAAGFPGLPPAATRWLLTQCTNYGDLHPGQQELLTGLGITPQEAHAVRPQQETRTRRRTGASRSRPTTVSSSIDGGLPYARSYAHTHGGLGTAHYTTEHDGFPLGWWLYEQRKRAVAHLRRTGRPWPHDTQLTTLDPWWNPPWRASWNHSYHQAHTHHTAGRPFPGTTTKWIRTQQQAWNQLHPHQQHLLTTLGIHGPVPLISYNSRPMKLTRQPIELTNGSTATPKQETHSSQTPPSPSSQATPSRSPTHRTPPAPTSQLISPAQHPGH
ncbi:helicase associated domain-containing protein [Streptomyces sp.]|uniref:helicase associated domain-containing protein n=1 Tax=Streptomyces sp. TaxID=1931 RepID=UPI0028124509|nr:helicase associated domain-containing protein [Streptomyces sp.]